MSFPDTAEKVDGASSGWERFIAHVQKDAKLWLFALALLSLFRWVAIWLFREGLGADSGLNDILMRVVNGLRYDVRVATFVTLPMLALGVVTAFWDVSRWADRLRIVVAIVYPAVTLVVCVVDVGYFREYNDQFNHRVLGVVFDDRVAIWRTIWQEHHVVLDVLLVAGVVVAGTWLLRRALRHPFVSSAKVAANTAQAWQRAVMCLGIAVLAVGFGRGSFSSRPMQMKDAGITRDANLNKLVFNPYAALFYAIGDYRKSISAAGVKTFLPDGDVVAAAKVAFPNASVYRSIDDLLRKEARGPAGKKPDHIFLIVMESYDSWPMLPKYQSLGLTGRLQALGRRGISITPFAPSADGTFQALNTMITGLPWAEVCVNYHPVSRQPLPTSVAPMFKRLGYVTRMYYGGYPGWQRIGEFCKDQGFDEVHCGGEMTRWGVGKEWGVDDDVLFRFIEEQTRPDQPSFNLIMTTSYHPPYSVDVYAKGCTLREMPAEVKPYHNGRVPVRGYAHLWYADQCLGNFVENMERKLGTPVFAITGDHFSRRFLNDTPNPFERNSVPFVLYGTAALQGISAPPRLTGGHMDIVPTLIELAAPVGFEYHSFGSNLLGLRPRQVGLGRLCVTGPDFVIAVKQPNEKFPVSSNYRPEMSPSTESLIRLQRAIHGLSWWRVMKGSDLPASSKVPQGQVNGLGVSKVISAEIKEAAAAPEIRGE